MAATFMEARVKIQADSDLTEQQFDRLMDEHAPGLSAELDLIMDDARDQIMRSWSNRVPGLKVVTVVD